MTPYIEIHKTGLVSGKNLTIVILQELSRNMSSYLSLAAIENADLLATHVQPILDSVISGETIGRTLKSNLNSEYVEKTLY